MTVNNLTPDLMQQVTAFAAILIAMLAFFLSMWQFLALRTHNRLSVKPHLSYEMFNVRTDMGFGINICNKGIGPAIIKKFQIFIDNTEIISETNQIWLKALQVMNCNYKFIQVDSLGKDTSISAGEKLPLLTIDEDVNKEQEELFQNALIRLDISIQYESIYKQKFTAKLKDQQLA